MSLILFVTLTISSTQLFYKKCLWLLTLLTLCFSARHREMVRVTGDAVESLHDAVLSAPDVDTVEETQPIALKVTLMDHQRRGLAWLCWRETQLPPGGILGKSLLA